MKLIYLGLILCFSIGLNAQISEHSISSVQGASLPEYPGGIDQLRDDINQRFLISKQVKKELSGDRTIIVKFMILEDGSIGKIELVKEFSQFPELSHSLIDAIRNLEKKFKPSYNAEGYPVKTWFILPIIIYK